MLPDVLEFAALYYGILRLGAVVVPMSPLLTERGTHYRLQDSGASALVCWVSSRASARPAAASLGVLVWFLESGGLPDLLGRPPRSKGSSREVPTTRPSSSTRRATTGESRGAELTHGNLLRNCEVVVNDLVQLTSDDVVLGGLPLFHSFGQTAGLNATVRAGACLVLLGRFDAGAALDTLRDRGVTVMEGAPTMYDAMLRHPRRADYELPRLRVCVTGGAAMPVEVLLGFEEAFHCLILEGYGLAETSPVASFNRMDRRRVGSIGVPVNGVELRVVDDAGLRGRGRRSR